MVNMSYHQFLLKQPHSSSRQSRRRANRRKRNCWDKLSPTNWQTWLTVTRSSVNRVARHLLYKWLAIWLPSGSTCPRRTPLVWGRCVVQSWRRGMRTCRTFWALTQEGQKWHVPPPVQRESQNFWTSWKVVLWHGCRTEARHGVKVSRGQQRSRLSITCLRLHPHLPLPAWVPRWQRSAGARETVAEVETAQREEAVICCLLSFLHCWVMAGRWIKVERSSAGAITTTTILPLMFTLGLLQRVRRSCPVSPILHPTPLQLLSHLHKIVLHPPRPCPRPCLCISPLAWGNARGPAARGPMVPCPLLPVPHQEHLHLTHQPKRVARRGSRRTKGKSRSWRSRMSVWKQRSNGSARRCKGHVEHWLRD